MNIDIFTDASVDQKTKEAGFAHWISCYQFEFQFAGYAGRKDTALAELHSINHALETLLSMSTIPVTQVHIYTDSMEAIHKLIHGRRHPAFFNMIEFTLKNGMRPRQVSDLFAVKHVKVHTGSSTTMSHKNRWCDMMAKQHRQTKNTFKATIFDNSDILL